MTETIAIIGAGQAGGSAAVTLRQEGYGGRIVLIGEEPHAPYERPPLSKAVLLGEAPSDATDMFVPEAFEALGVDFRRGVRATAIDREQRRVTLSEGEPVHYDRLIIATGGRARALPVPGADLPGIHTLRTREDAERLRESLRPGARVVVIGGGWIGLEVAATARHCDAEVTVLEAAQRLCQRSVSAPMSEFLAELHVGRGVTLRLAAAVTEITAADEALAVRVGADLIPADAVVVGVGLEPAFDIARDAGLNVDSGILVGTDTRTNDPDVFAAGDVTMSPNPWAGGTIRLESWQNAQDQGAAAARAALGQEVTYEPVPYFWSDQYDVRVQMFGIPAENCRTVQRGAMTAEGFVLFQLVDGRVVAAMGANSPKDLRIAKRMIERRMSVDPEILADTSRALPRK